MLKIDVIRFEAQDVITTSVAEPVTCICNRNCYRSEYTGHYELLDNHQEKCHCPADEHRKP